MFFKITYKESTKNTERIQYKVH